MFTRRCALPDCGVEFQTDNSRKMHCSTAHSDVHRQRRARSRRRKGGGGNGGGNGGGSGPTLFDTITPVDAGAAFVPIPVIGPSERKPAESVNPETSPAPASKKAAA